MSTIKFRAWNPVDKRMYESGGTPSMLSGFFGGDKPGIVRDNCAVMQFIGFTDKNGKEIYEGDILEFKTPYGVMREAVKDIRDAVYDIRESWGPFEEREVIGNIYENPELLKKSANQEENDHE